LLALLAAIAGSGNAPAGAVSGTDFLVTANPEPLCEQPAGADPAVLAGLAGDAGRFDLPEYAAWTEGHEYGIEAVVAAMPESGTDGYFGLYIDYVERELVLVVDPQVRRLEEDARLIASLTVPVPRPEDAGPIPEDWIGDPSDWSTSGEGWGAAPAPAPLAVEVRASCVSFREAMSVLGRLTAADWSPKLEEVGWSALIDPALGGRVEITLPAGRSAERADVALVPGVRMGENVVIRDGEWMPRGRMNDGSPHYGGAAIGHYWSQHCTGGFALTNDGTHKFMVTAGHCTEPAGGDWYSGGPVYWASTYANYWTTYDIKVLGSHIHQYSRIIHTDPGAPTTRLVNSKADATVSYTNICNSGKVTKAICGISVKSWSGSISCGGRTFTPSMSSWATKPGKTIGTLGDSGSPVYYRNGSSTARIVGMHTCGRVHDEILFLKPSHIEAVTGMAVATSCCNSNSW
jgi:hypothetical protein